MLTISQPFTGTGPEHYFMKVAREDYWTREQPGQWHGQGATLLGLGGQVQPAAFHHLLQGRSPDGRQALVQNAQAADRHSAWDHTFSTCKSVSVVWALAPEPLRRQIEFAHQTAVKKTLDWLERTAGVTRRGPGGKIKERAALVWATFQHGTSRALDPQLHTHAVLINLGVRRDGTTGALQSKDLFQAKMAAGARYQRELARDLGALGLTLEPAAHGFRMAGVPEALCQAFSRRRQAILVRLQEHGQHGAVAAKAAALATRPKKMRVGREELRTHWRHIAAAHGWTDERLRQLLRPPPCRMVPPDLEDRRPQEQVAARPDRRMPPPQRTPREPAPVAPGAATCGNTPETPQTNSRKDRQWLPTPSWPRPTPSSWAGTEIPRPGQASRWLHVEWQPMFPKAPWWSPARRWRGPVLVRRRRRPPPRWGRVLWRKRLLVGEVRVQQRRLFPKAPGWSPARRLTLPAVRVLRASSAGKGACQPQQLQRTY